MDPTLFFVGLATVLTLTSASAQVNSWTDASANWDQPSSWSLGVLPDSSQSIMITNSGWKAVDIDSSTIANFPASLTVRDLAVSGPTNTLNTLLLNSTGLGTPLKVLNSCSIGTNGIIDNEFSSFEVDGSGLLIDGGGNTVQTGGYFTQMGGMTVVNGPVFVRSGEFDATNGNLTLGDVTMGSTTPTFGYFIQDGGTLLAQHLTVESGAYTLASGGILYAIGGTRVGAFASFNHGGTNYGDITLTNAGGSYRIGAGLAQGNVLTVAADFEQHGGLVDMQEVDWSGRSGGLYGGDLRCDTLNASGTAELDIGTQWPFPPGSVTAGTFNISGTASVGVFSYPIFVTNSVEIGGDSSSSNATLVLRSTTLGVPNLAIHQHSTVVQADGGFGGGLTEISNSLAMDGGEFQLWAGKLETPDLEVGLNANFAQVFGENDVHGVLSITGNYDLGGGTLMVDGLYLRGSLVLQVTNSSNTNQATTFTNTGSVDLGGYLGAGLTNAWPGQARLSANAAVDFIATPAQLKFAPSSGVSWAPGALMVVSNWNNSGNTRLFFGADASGLSASQLAQIQFSNPGGFAPGIYSAKILNNGEVVPDQMQGQGTATDVNSWISPTSGNWDDASSWSLGVLPNRSQSVMITNSNWKAVAINPSTPVNFPDSMTVSNLTIRGATNTENTLLLNSFGTAVPLTVLNGLTLQDDAQILNFDSSLDVQSGAITVTNSQIIQDGGFVRITNATMFLRDSAYYLTNGIFEGGTVWLGLPVAGHFNQYGGTVTISDLEFGRSGVGDGGSYALYGGNLNLPNGLTLLGENNSSESYFQADGTNRTTQVSIEPGLFGGGPGFTLNGGLLADNDVSVLADTFGSVTFNQNGGSHAITGSLFITGGAPNGNVVFPATYNLNGGTLSASLIELNADEGDALFVQSNGTASAGTISVHSGGFFASHNTLVSLTGGTLSCSNFTTVDGGGKFNQSGGALVVSNLLDFGGSRDTGARVIFGHYTFTGGTVTASNINITGVWIIGDGSANRISNPGFFSLAHTLQISNAVEQLGRFVLASNATIDLSGSASRLSFAKSSSQAWGAGAALVVTNWNGNPAGGGAEQLKFGTDQTGLTAAQLNQIQFQLGTNSFSAKILNTGEVVPDHVITQTVTFSTQGKNFVLSWPSGWSLQSATNAAGPYSDVQNATSPYTNDMTADPQRFFRLRH